MASLIGSSFGGIVIYSSPRLPSHDVRSPSHRQGYFYWVYFAIIRLATLNLFRWVPNVDKDP